MSGPSTIPSMMPIMASPPLPGCRGPNNDDHTDYESIPRDVYVSRPPTPRPDMNAFYREPPKEAKTEKTHITRFFLRCFGH